MRRLLRRSVWIVGAAAVLLWVGVAVQGVQLAAMGHEIGRLGRELERRERPARAAVVSLDRLPFHRGPTCAPAALRLARIFREAGIDSFSYLADLGTGEAVEEPIADLLRARVAAGEAGEGPALVRLQEIRIRSKARYEAVRDLLDRLRGSRPVLGIRAVRMRSSGGDVEIDVEAIALGLEI